MSSCHRFSAEVDVAKLKGEVGEDDGWWTTTGEFDLYRVLLHYIV